MSNNHLFDMHIRFSFYIQQVSDGLPLCKILWKIMHKFMNNLANI